MKMFRQISKKIKSCGCEINKGYKSRTSCSRQQRCFNVSWPPRRPQ